MSEDRDDYTKPIESVKLRPILESDLELVQTIVEQSGVGIMPYDPDLYSRLLRYNGDLSLIAEIGGTPVGLALVAKKLAHGDSYSLLQVAVLPEWRGLRIGKALVKGVQKKIESVDRNSSLAVYADPNNSYLLKVLKQTGFKKTGKTREDGKTGNSVGVRLISGTDWAPYSDDLSWLYPGANTLHLKTT